MTYLQEYNAIKKLLTELSTLVKQYDTEDASDVLVDIITESEYMCSTAISNALRHVAYYKMKPVKNDFTRRVILSAIQYAKDNQRTARLTDKQLSYVLPHLTQRDIYYEGVIDNYLISITGNNLYFEVIVPDPDIKEKLQNQINRLLEAVS